MVTITFIYRKADGTDGTTVRNYDLNTDGTPKTGILNRWFNVPTRSMCRIAGWYTANDTYVSENTDLRPLGEAFTLDAGYYADLTLNSNGGIIPNIGNEAIVTIFADTATEIPSHIPEKTYNTFIGWSAAAGSLDTIPSTITITGHTTIYAVWAPTEYAFTLRLMPNGGIVSAGDYKEYTKTQASQYMVFQLPTASEAGISWPDSKYAFHSWNTDSRAIGLRYEPGDYYHAHGPGIHTLYATYSYTITYDTDGGIPIAPFTSIKGMATPLPKPTLQGRLFVGWYSDAGRTIYAGRDGTPFHHDGNITLYAKWAEDYVTLTYYSNTGDGVRAAYTLARGSQHTLESEGLFASYGLNQMGWSVHHASTEAELAFGGTITVNDNTDIYAIYEIQPESREKPPMDKGCAIRLVSDYIYTDRAKTSEDDVCNYRTQPEEGGNNDVTTSVSIDLGFVSQIVQTLSLSATVSTITSATSDDTMIIPKGNTKTYHLSFSRVQRRNIDEDKPMTYGDSEVATGSTYWSNGHWYRVLKDVVNRWQFETNGFRLYLFPESNLEYPTTENETSLGYKNYGINCYVTDLTTDWKNNNADMITGSMTIEVGGNYETMTNLYNITYRSNFPESMSSNPLYDDRFITTYALNATALISSSVPQEWINLMAVNGYGIGAVPQWYVKDASGVPMERVLSGNATVQMTQSLILELIWVSTSDTYTITFNANGASGSPPDAITLYAGSWMQIPPLKKGEDAMYKSGFEVIGWATSPSANTPDYYMDGTYFKPTGSMTLYAVWNPVINIYDATGLRAIGTGQTITQNGKPYHMVNQRGVTYNIMADIDASSVDWVPLCSKASPFLANLNGNGNTIKIRTATSRSVSPWYLTNNHNPVMSIDLYEHAVVPYWGLFASAEGGNIYDVSVNVDYRIVSGSEKDTVSKDVCIGGIAGHAKNVVFSRCNVYGRMQFAVFTGKTSADKPVGGSMTPNDYLMSQYRHDVGGICGLYEYDRTAESNGFYFCHMHGEIDNSTLSETNVIRSPLKRRTAIGGICGRTASVQGTVHESRMMFKGCAFHSSASINAGQPGGLSKSADLHWQAYRLAIGGICGKAENPSGRNNKNITFMSCQSNGSLNLIGRIDGTPPYSILSNSAILNSIMYPEIEEIHPTGRGRLQSWIVREESMFSFGGGYAGGILGLSDRSVNNSDAYAPRISFIGCLTSATFSLWAPKMRTAATFSTWFIFTETRYASVYATPLGGAMYGGNKNSVSEFSANTDYLTNAGSYNYSRANSIRFDDGQTNNDTISKVTANLYALSDTKSDEHLRTTTTYNYEDFNFANTPEQVSAERPWVLDPNKDNGYPHIAHGVRWPQ